MLNEVTELGQAIYCECFDPFFLKQKVIKHKVLGSITSEGIIEILRAHKNKTVIKAAEFLISCQDCGYRKYIHIESMAQKQPAYEVH